MYSMEINKEKKAFIVRVGGFFKEGEGEKFLEEYQENITKFNPREYNFVICGKDLKTSSQDAVQILDQCLKLYKSTGYKSYYTTMPASPTAKMQLNKLLDANNLKMEIGETVEGILQKL